MTVRRKKPARAPRITAYRPWDETWAKLFIGTDGWTPPDQIKLVHGKASGTYSAIFLDQKGGPVEVYARFRVIGGKIEITEQGLRASYRWTLKGRQK